MAPSESVLTYIHFDDPSLAPFCASSQSNICIEMGCSKQYIFKPRCGEEDSWKSQNEHIFTLSLTSYGYNMESGKTPIALNYEKKLNEFRARRRRQELIDNAKSSLNKVISFMEPNSNSKRNATEETSEECQSLNLDEQRRNREDILLSEELSDNFDYVDITSETSCDTLESVDSDLSTCWNWGKVALYGTLWLSLFGLAVYAEFGFVFVILSGFVFIWFNTRTGPKRRGEISAYSVFNPDCAPIDGTLDARQFENEIRGGMGF